jgi:hypothetical protein
VLSREVLVYEDQDIILCVDFELVYKNEKNNIRKIETKILMSRVFKIMNEKKNELLIFLCDIIFMFLYGIVLLSYFVKKEDNILLVLIGVVSINVIINLYIKIEEKRLYDKRE